MTGLHLPSNTVGKPTRLALVREQTAMGNLRTRALQTSHAQAPDRFTPLPRPSEPSRSRSGQGRRPRSHR